MKTNMMITLLACTGLLAGCGEKKEAGIPDKEATKEFVATTPVGTPIPIPEARTQFKAGDSVVLTGLVMGTPHPFVEGRGVFVLGEVGVITPCDELHGDSCKTPWDTCCDTPENKAVATATIQILGEDGRPIRTGVKGMNGLKELSRVTVAGTVDDRSTPEAFIVNASAIHVGVR